ncbi:MAG: hypothetical protein M5R41_10640 [Bacteroidia bacterium]|nr:hypothetical protein [Bacteroidia bacterium]
MMNTMKGLVHATQTGFFLMSVPFLLGAAFSVAGAQTGTASEEKAPPPRNLHLVVRTAPDSIVLRWGTTDYVTWKTAAAAGYVIERAELAKRGGASLEPQWKRLTEAPLKPLRIEDWKLRFAPEDSLAGAAVQSFYGESISTTNDPFGSLYEMYLQQQNLHGFGLFLADIRPDLADGLGLRFADRSVERGKPYVYRLYAATQNPDNPVDTAFAVATAKDDNPLTPVTKLTAVEDEKLVVLRWDREESAAYGGFVIERSKDGGGSFTRVTPLPYLPLVNPSVEDVGSYHEYRVKQQRNYEAAQYRVSGVNAFGMLSPAGTVVTAMGRDKTAPRQPAILPHEIVDEVSVKISWEVRDTPDKDLDGFIIAKSESPDGPYDIISDLLPVGARTYTDSNVRDLPPHYYVVSAVDTAGNSRMSAPMFAVFPDSIPPATPSGLVGSVDSSGVVLLRWTSNTEQDLQGYRVFYANDPSHEFQQLTTTIGTDTIYTDTLTLKTLSKHIYYKVTALDWNFNHSPFTPALEVKKPDIVPPSAPVIRDVQSAVDAVTISWYRSPTSDAREHVLLRRRVGETQWRELLRTDEASRTTHRDEGADAGEVYEYAVQARDEDGLLSPLSNIVNARKVAAGTRPGAEQLVARYDAQSNAVQLQWRFTGNRPCEFYLYRGASASPQVLIRTEGDAASGYADRDVRSGATYVYAVKVVYPDGGESPLVRAEAVSIP